MKKIAYIICGVVALMATHTLSAQTLNTAYFMEGAYQRTNLNPALTPTRDYFSLPVLGGTTLELSSNYLALHNYFFKHGDQTVTALHGSVTPSEFLGNFAQNNKLSFGINSSLLGVGFRHKNMYWNFGLNLRSQSDGVLSKDLFSAIKTFGNGDYDLGNTSLNSTTYAEVYLGTTYDVLDWITVGARAKFLIGILNLTSEFDAMHISVSSNRIIGQMRGTLRLNGVCFNSNNVNEGDDLSGDIFNMGSISSFGAAIDLGTEIRLLDNRLKISAAVTDLGFIRWSKDGYIEASTSGDFHFNGFNLEKVEADAAGDFNATYRGVKSTGYTTRINCSLNVGAEYNVLNNRIGFGLLSHTEFCSNMTYTELTASVNFRPLNWLSASVSHTFLNRNNLGVLGFALNIHPTGFNLFVGCDYMGFAYAKTNVINVPSNLNSINLYVGVGFNISKYKGINYGKVSKKAKKGDK